MKLKTKVRWAKHPDKIFLLEEVDFPDGTIYSVIREYDPEAEKTQEPQLAYGVNGISSEFSLHKDELTILEEE